MYIEELNRNLNAGQMEIWLGTSAVHSPETCEKYRKAWRAAASGKAKPQKAERIPLTLASMPCPHRAENVIGTVKCAKCSLLPSMNVYGCSLHAAGCVIENRPLSNSIKWCSVCDHRPLAHKGGLSAAQLKETQPPTPINEANSFIASIPSYPEGKYSGRGVVIAAGGNYWASAYITVRMLRHVGCTLPVECWYLGNSGERDERYERLLVPHNVVCRDIDTHPARAARRVVKGFGTKLFAVVNSAFEEVLLLDPDNYPCADPTILFDVPLYQRLGGIYWPDRTFTEKWTNWKVWGCAKRGPCGLETGQYVLQKRTAWEPMLLAEWYDDRPEIYYGRPTLDNKIEGGGDYGDKGSHRAAWAKLNRDYVVFNPVATHRGFAYLQPGPDGRTPMFIHRCHSKFVAEGPLGFEHTPQSGENLRGGYPGEEVAFGFLEELKASLASEVRP